MNSFYNQSELISQILIFITLAIFIKIFNKNKKDKVNQTSKKLLEEDLVHDSFGITEEAISSLKKAIFVESNEQEQKRLNIILSKYIERKPNLLEFVKKNPTFLTQTK